MHRSAHRTRRHGYTLIELIIVIALLGMASALLVPQLVGRDVLRAEAAVRQLIADLSFAQSDALAHQELRRVHFYDDGRGYCIVRLTTAELDDDFNAATADYIDDPLASAGNLGAYIVDYFADDRWEGLEITAVDIDDEDEFVTYDELGGTITSGQNPGTGGTIELTYTEGDDTAVYEITVAAFTGKLSVTKTE